MTNLSDFVTSAFWRVNAPDADPAETREWLEAFDALVRTEGRERATFLLRKLLDHARVRRVPLPPVLNTPYKNSVAIAEQPQFPGNLELERRGAFPALLAHQRVERLQPLARLGRIGVRSIDAPERRGDEIRQVGHSGMVFRSRGKVIRSAPQRLIRTNLHLSPAAFCSVCSGSQIPSSIVMPGFSAPGLVAVFV